MVRTVKSAERTLALFEMFSKVQRGLTVGQISQELHVPQPSATMLLRNLTALGYLEYDVVKRTYIPSIRVVLLGSWIERMFGETQSLITRLDTLQRRAGETAYIAVQNGSQGQYVMVQHPDTPNSLKVESGNFRTLTCTAFGRALLALKPDAEVLSWMKRCNSEAAEERLKVSRSEFMRIMAETRQKGYGESNGEQTPGLGAYAVTFRLPTSSMHLAVGVGGPLARIKRRERFLIRALEEFRYSFESEPAKSAVLEAV